MNISTRASEILLVAILLIMVGFTRIYYGGPDGLMVVWKGSFGYSDTLVNLAEFYTIPRAEAASRHPHVLYQLEEMGVLDSSEPIVKPAKKVTPVKTLETPDQPEKSTTPAVNH